MSTANFFPQVPFPWNYLVRFFFFITGATGMQLLDHYLLSAWFSGIRLRFTNGDRGFDSRGGHFGCTLVGLRGIGWTDW